MQVCCVSVLCECECGVCVVCVVCVVCEWRGAVCVLCSRLGCSRAHAILVLPTVPLKHVLSNGQESVCYYTNRHCTPRAVHHALTRCCSHQDRSMNHQMDGHQSHRCKLGGGEDTYGDHPAPSHSGMHVHTCAYIHTYIHTQRYYIQPHM